MKLEHKIGIAITCTFLCLTGAVIGLKMQQDQPAPEVKDQVASNSKDIETPKGKQMNLSVPTMGGEPPPNPSSSIGEKPQGSKGDKDMPDGSANVKPPDKSNASKNSTAPSFDFGSNNRPAFQPPTDPRPTVADSGNAPERRKQPPTEVEGFNFSPSGPMTDAKPQTKGPDKNDKPTDKQQNNGTPATVGIFLPGNDGGSASSSSTGSPGGRDNPKGSGMSPSSTGAVPPAITSDQGGNVRTTSAEKDKGKNGTTLNTKSENETTLNSNNPSAPSLSGSASTGAAPKPAPAAPAAPTKPNIIPIGAFDGSQPPPPSPPPTLEMDPGKPAAPSSNSTTGGTAPALNWSPNPTKPSKDNVPSQGNSSPMSPSKPADPKTGDGKPAPSPILSGEKGNEDKSTGSPPPPPPSPTMDKPSDNKTPPAPAPAASPPAPASKPADDSYFIPDPRSTTGSGTNNTTGSGGRSAAAPPGLLPYPVMPGSPPSGSPSGTEGVKPVTTGGAATAPQTVARPQPQVIVYDEQEYRAAAGDTFEKISAKYYGTPAFADALKQHNRHHARASVQMTNEGTLAPGERLYIPPADILEQRYGDTIVKPPSSPSQAVPASFNSPGVPSGK